MTEDSERHSTRRSRSRQRPGRICRRAGCDRPREVVDQTRHEFCCYLCRVIHFEERKVKRVCEALGSSPATDELWSSAVAMSEALSRYLAADAELQDAARSVGLSDEQWQAIKEGRAA